MAELELSIIILAFNEAENLKILIPQVKAVVGPLDVGYEIVILDGNSNDCTVQVARGLGCRVAVQDKPGYGNAFKQAIMEAKGKVSIFLDADCSHSPEFIKKLWNKRDCCQLAIASRYVRQGSANMPACRRFLSILLNRVYAAVLDVPYRDLSSGFRLYKSDSVKDIVGHLTGRDFDILLEVLLKMHCAGYEIMEIPFHYYPRNHGKSSARIFKFGISYLKTLYHAWQVRNSNFSADYDSRAFNSVIPLQRYWQRKRYEIIMGMVEKQGLCIDIGCGSSKIIQNLPNAIGMDLDLKKLRFLKDTGRTLVKGDIHRLPFKNKVFDEVICSEVIEHIPKSRVELKELNRIIVDGGILILGTPDYASFWWNLIEWFYARILPNAYAEGHIAHYTYAELLRLLEESGFEVLTYRYICQSELIIKAKKLSPVKALINRKGG